MAAITGTYGLVKYQSIALKATVGSSGDTISNADLVTVSGLAAITTSSPLKTFLAATYADAAAAETAFRAVGGRIEYRLTSGGANTDNISIGWTASAGLPSLALAGGSNGVYEIRISTPHSAIQ